MNVKRLEAAEFDRLGEAIRKYRKETRLTQAQFAVALGVAPTSIYRYEAGASTPDVGTLQKLYMHADKEGNEDAKTVFYHALRAKAGLSIIIDGIDEVSSDLSNETKNRLSLIRHLQVQGRPLTPREQLLAIAFVLMLRNNVDESSDKMMRLLLEPWMKAAKDELDPH
jgi:transcriptional regulator with XRE-family HTH domain